MEEREKTTKKQACLGSTAAHCYAKEADFIKRYVDALEPLGLSPEMATESAEASFEQWDGVDTPEECAQEEMYAWAADA